MEQENPIRPACVAEQLAILQGYFPQLSENRPNSFRLYMICMPTGMPRLTSYPEKISRIYTCITFYIRWVLQRCSISRTDLLSWI